MDESKDYEIELLVAGDYDDIGDLEITEIDSYAQTT